MKNRKILESKRKRDSNPLLDEINIMRAWDHPNVIKLYEVYEAEKHVHLVMEVLEGGELFNRIRNKGLYTEADAIKVMRNILEALAYLHSKGIVHRDLKPENLILANAENDENVKIADFGLATFVKPGQKLDLPCGSPGYVAYELLQDPSPGYDTKADIYSVGVILYILLTGRPAFHGADYKQILAKNKQGEPPYPKRFWHKISEHGQQLVKCMIENDQDKRLTAQAALAHEWFQDEEAVKDEVLSDVADGFKEFQEKEIDTKIAGSDVSNPLLTVTPVMAGRKLKDTCESPWNPSGFTPKLNDATPMLRHGFTDNKPKRIVNIPGVGAIGGGAAEQEEEKKGQVFKPFVPKKNNQFSDFAKLDEIEQKRKQRNTQGTQNFGTNGVVGISRINKEEEEKKTNTNNLPVIPNKIEKPLAIGTEKGGSILDRILESNPKETKPKEEEVKPWKLDNSPETKPKISDKVLRLTDAEVNITEDELKECPEGGSGLSDRDAIFKSFKPGNCTDLRIIPTTPGDNQVSMRQLNKPRGVKNRLLQMV